MGSTPAESGKTANGVETENIPRPSPEGQPVGSTPAKSRRTASGVVGKGELRPSSEEQPMESTPAKPRKTANGVEGGVGASDAVEGKDMDRRNKCSTQAGAKAAQLHHKTDAALHPFANTYLTLKTSRRR